MVNWFELMKRVQIKPAWSEIIQLLWCCMQWEYSNNQPTILLDSDNWKSILCIYIFLDNVHLVYVFFCTFI